MTPLKNLVDGNTLLIFVHKQEINYPVGKYIDKSMMEVVLRNFIVNAANTTYAGGTVSVSVSHHKDPENLVLNVDD
jgi:hypothetical protein